MNKIKVLAIGLIILIVLVGCVSRTTLGKEFCPIGYSDDGGTFEWDQYCQGKPFTCSTASQECYYIADESKEKIE